jgi:hypothetical protein
MMGVLRIRTAEYFGSFFEQLKGSKIQFTEQIVLQLENTRENKTSSW